MNKFKKLDFIFLGGIILLIIACVIHVTVEYVKIFNNVATSAPASIAFLWIIPYAIGILTVLAIWIIVKKLLKNK